MEYLKLIAAIALCLSPFALLGFQVWKQWRLTKAQRERHRREIARFRKEANDILQAELAKDERRKRERSV